MSLIGAFGGQGSSPFQSLLGQERSLSQAPAGYEPSWWEALNALSAQSGQREAAGGNYLDQIQRATSSGSYAPDTLTGQRFPGDPGYEQQQAMRSPSTPGAQAMRNFAATGDMATRYAPTTRANPNYDPSAAGNQGVDDAGATAAFTPTQPYGRHAGANITPENYGGAGSDYPTPGAPSSGAPQGYHITPDPAGTFSSDQVILNGRPVHVGPDGTLMSNEEFIKSTANRMPAMPTKAYAQNAGGFIKNASGQWATGGTEGTPFEWTSVSPGEYRDYMAQAGSAPVLLGNAASAPDVLPGAGEMFKDNRPTFAEQFPSEAPHGVVKESDDKWMMRPSPAPATTAPDTTVPGWNKGVNDFLTNNPVGRAVAPTLASGIRGPNLLEPTLNAMPGAGYGTTNNEVVNSAIDNGYNYLDAPRGIRDNVNSNSPAGTGLEPPRTASDVASDVDAAVQNEVATRPAPTYANNPDVSLEAAKATPLPTGASTTIPPTNKIGSTPIDLTKGETLPTLDSTAAVAGPAAAGAGAATPAPSPTGPSPYEKGGLVDTSTGTGTPPVVPPTTPTGGGTPPAPAGVDPAWWASIIGPAIGGIVGGASSWFGADKIAAAEKEAAQIQANAALEAAKLQDAQQTNYLKTLNDQFAQQQKNLAPWVDAGGAALKDLQGFEQTNPASPEYRSFTDADYQRDKGYDFRLSEGLKALQNSAAARGGLLSGNTLKGITQYGQDMASQEWQNAFGRFHTEQQNRFNQNQATRGMNLNRLQSLAGVGQSAVQQANQSGQNYANSIGQAGQNYANQVGQLGMGGAQARAGGVTGAAAANASGYMGAGNALTNALNQGYNMWQGNQMLSLLRNR